MKTPLTTEILKVIYLMQTQKKAYATLHNSILKDGYDYFKDLKELYKKLPLPEGLNTSTACFESVIGYSLTDEIMQTEAENLPKKFVFGY